MAHSFYTMTTRTTTWKSSNKYTIMKSSSIMTTTYIFHFKLIAYVSNLSFQPHSRALSIQGAAAEASCSWPVVRRLCHTSLPLSVGSNPWQTLVRTPSCTQERRRCQGGTKKLTRNRYCQEERSPNSKSLDVMNSWKNSQLSDDSTPVASLE